MKDGSPGEQEDRRVEHIIPAKAVKAGKYTCYVEVTCNGMFGLGPSRYLHPDVSVFSYPKTELIIRPTALSRSSLPILSSQIPTHAVFAPTSASSRRCLVTRPPRRQVSLRRPSRHVTTL